MKPEPWLTLMRSTTHRTARLMFAISICDFLACSTYKFFGPHMGVLYGKREHLARLTPYKVRANTNAVPQRWEWGTLNHECIGGITACVEYLAEVGRRSEQVSDRRAAIQAAYRAIQSHER